MHSWFNGIQHEIGFWNYWLDSKGGPWTENYIERLNPDREFAPWLLQKIPEPGTAKILDVGSGPINAFGYKYKGKNIDITISDPLALFYKEMLNSRNLNPPIVPVVAFAEELSVFFTPETFDLVTCNNALDHSFEPLRGIEEMLIVTKRDGLVHLGHVRNEAVRMNYEGLHQWNFDEYDGKFIIWNKEERINVDENLGGIAEIDTFVDKKTDYITVYLRKKNNFSESIHERHRDRLARLLPATLSVIYQQILERRGTASGG